MQGLTEICSKDVSLQSEHWCLARYKIYTLLGFGMSMAHSLTCFALQVVTNIDRTVKFLF